MEPSSTCNHTCNQTELDQAQIAWENEADAKFMAAIQAEVTQSCALPFALPLERLPMIITQAAQWFWENDDWSVEERMYAIPNKEICRGNGAGTGLNKIITLPPQIVSVYGAFKIQTGLKYGVLGDFSLERMLMSSYSMFGGVGAVGGGFGGFGNPTGYKLIDVVAAMYEIDTFDQTLNPPLTFNYNYYSHKLVLLGALDYSDLLIQTYIRCRIQDLYNNYYFFRYCVCLAKRSLSTIYGTYEFKYPGGVSINYSNFSDQANDEIEKIEEAIKARRGCAYIAMPNTL